MIRNLGALGLKFWLNTPPLRVNVDFIPQDNLTICSVAIRKCDDSFARTTLYLARGSEHEDSVALGTLSAQTVDQLSVEVKLAKSIQYSLHVEGPNPISVIGYYIGTGDGIVKRRHDSKRPRSDDSDHGRGSKRTKVEDGTKLKVKSHSSKHSEGKNRDPREGPGLVGLRTTVMDNISNTAGGAAVVSSDLEYGATVGFSINTSVDSTNNISIQPIHSGLSHPPQSSNVGPSNNPSQHLQPLLLRPAIELRKIAGRKRESEAGKIPKGMRLRGQEQNVKRDMMLKLAESSRRFLEVLSEVDEVYTASTNVVSSFTKKGDA
ncbi:MAG: hypothetical protein NXY57DRAFT_969232 [Lentinula lateritia]|nr:MAG: hypothetical protein NXY57DRAFT_969232 [Lentinula lateritia]